MRDNLVELIERNMEHTRALTLSQLCTRAVKTLTRMKAKNVVEEMRAGLTPISFFIKKPGPPPEVSSSVAIKISRRVHSLVACHTGPSTLHWMA